MPRHLWARYTGDIAGFKCRDLTYNLSPQCRACVGVLISRFNRPFLKELVGSELRNFNIICLTETWLGPNTTDEAMRIDDYSLYRRDRPTENHGGVCVYIKEDIYSRRRTDLELPHVERVCVEINIHHKKILIGTFYRPPNSPAQTLSYIEDSIN